MDPVVVLDTDRLSVDPGGVAVASLTVRNLSNRVESYDLTVLGPAAAWAEVVPSQLRVYTQDEARATVSFTPPGGTAAPAGVVPFGVIARSTVDVGSSASAEGDLTVGLVSQLSARLVPVTADARWSTRHRFEVSNWGNTTARLALSVSDPDEKLAFLLEPEVLTVPVGATASAQVRVRAREPFLRGTPVRRPFRVTARVLAPGDDPHATPAAPPGQPFDPTVPGADGALQQRPVLSRLAVLGGLGAVAGLAALSFLDAREGGDEAFALRPTTPTGFAAAPGAEAGTVRLTWEPSPGVDGYRIDPAGIIDRPPIPVDGAQNEQTVPDLQPGQERCFELVALRAGTTSDPTEQRCATAAATDGPDGQTVPPGGEGGSDGEGTDPGGGDATEGGPAPGPDGTGSGTGSGDGSGGDGEGSSSTSPSAPEDLEGASVTSVVTDADGLVLNEDRWIVVVSPTPATDSLAPVLDRRDRRRAEYGRDDVHVLSTRHYAPAPEIPPEPHYYVYVPARDEADAEQLCQALAVVPCVTFQPRPNAVASD